jgi:hypothetical protein
MNMARHEIYKLIQDLSISYKSSYGDLVAKIYEKFMEYDNNGQVSFFDIIINNLIESLESESGNPHYSNAVEYLSYALDLVLRSGKTRAIS